MPELYEEDRQRRIRQPNLTRQRHRFKGPRESEKINQEIYQIRYDAMKLHQKLDEVEQILDDLYELIFNEDSASNLNEILAQGTTLNTLGVITQMLGSE